MFDAMDNNPWDKAEENAFKAFELYEDGDLTKALKLLEEAIDVNPGNSDLFFNAGLTLDAMGRFKGAIEAYGNALELRHDDLEILNCLAVDFTRIGCYDKSLETFEKIQSIDPDFEPCYCNRIITYTEMEKHDLAEHMFYLAQHINPECPICFYNIGNSLFSRQQYKKAIWCWEKTADIEPNHPQINFRIAQAYWASDNDHLAKVHFLKAIRNNPGEVDIILEYGIFLLQTGNIEDAREKFNRILELDPDSATARFYLAEIALRQGHSEKAKELFIAASEQDSTMPGPRQRLAQLAIESGNYKDAIIYLKTEMDLDIEDNEVLSSIGTMLMELGDYDRAVDSFLKVVDQDPENHQAFYHLGVSLAMQNQYDGALQFFEHAIRQGSTSPELYAHAAYLYLGNNCTEKAAQAIEQAICLEPDNRTFGKLARKIRYARAVERVSARICRFVGNIKYFARKR